MMKSVTPRYCSLIVIGHVCAKNSPCDLLQLCRKTSKLFVCKDAVVLSAKSRCGRPLLKKKVKGHSRHFSKTPLHPIKAQYWHVGDY